LSTTFPDFVSGPAFIALITPVNAKDPVRVIGYHPISRVHVKEQRKFSRRTVFYLASRDELSVQLSLAPHGFPK
jgi:hypothetical protein